jgi:hypothetical protein
LENLKLMDLIFVIILRENLIKFLEKMLNWAGILKEFQSNGENGYQGLWATYVDDAVK